jgi:hypothetical protein
MNQESCEWFHKSGIVGEPHKSERVVSHKSGMIWGDT